ncbi:MAG: hypothetical protein AAFV85_10880 [Cyanobacteria bacterium J06634_6]
MTQQDLQPYLDIAISVLEKKDVSATAKLKDFLLSLPGPAHIEQALGLSVVYFAKHSVVTFDWILSNQAMLSPELDLKAFTRKLIVQQLSASGWVYGEDFEFESGRLLLRHQDGITRLEENLSEGELMLLQATFLLDASLPT